MALQLASKRGHTAERLSVKPSIGNILLWRSVYKNKDQFFVDAILVNPFSGNKIYPGGQTQAVSIDESFNDIDKTSVLHKDIERFAFFSDYYLSFHPKSPEVLGDLRYAMLPNSTEPLWGIVINKDEPNKHIKNARFRDASKRNWSELLRMLKGK